MRHKQTSICTVYISYKDNVVPLYYLIVFRGVIGFPSGFKKIIKGLFIIEVYPVQEMGGGVFHFFAAPPFFRVEKWKTPFHPKKRVTYHPKTKENMLKTSLYGVYMFFTLTLCQSFRQKNEDRHFFASKNRRPLPFPCRKNSTCRVHIKTVPKGV